MLNRRDAIRLTGAGMAVAVTGLPDADAASDVPTAYDIIAELTDGAPILEGRINLTIADIAENGHNVPIEVSVDSPMTPGDHVREVTILAPENPNSKVARFTFTPLSGKALTATRIRLARSQQVTAIAKMSDGTFFQTTKAVRVTVGGCGS